MIDLCFSCLVLWEIRISPGPSNLLSKIIRGLCFWTGLERPNIQAYHGTAAATVLCMLEVVVFSRPGDDSSSWSGGWRWRTHWEHTECIVFGRNFRCGKSSYQTCLKQAKTIKLCSGLVLQPKMKRLGITHKNYNCKEQVTFQKYEKLTLCSSSLALSWSK